MRYPFSSTELGVKDKDLTPCMISSGTEKIAAATRANQAAEWRHRLPRMRGAKNKSVPFFNTSK